MPNPPGQQFCRLGSWSLLYGLSLPLIIALMPPEDVKRREKGIGEDEGDQSVQQPCSNPSECPEISGKLSLKKYTYLQDFCKL
jgi:hypothetical protein